MRGCSFEEIHETPMSDADKANGFEWMGETGVTCQLIRECEDMGNGCTEWKDWGSATAVFGFTRFGRTVEISKRNGKWFAGPSPIESVKSDKIDCEAAQREVAKREGH